MTPGSAPTPPNEPTAAPSADESLGKIQAKLRELREKKAAEEVKTEFAKRTPEQVRQYIKEMIEKGQRVDRELAQKVLAHESGKPIVISGIEAAIAETMTPDQIIDSLITNINRDERYNVFNSPDNISEESANQRKIEVEALAKREGIVVQIILQQTAIQPEKAAILLTKFVKAMKDGDPKAVPPALGIELAQRFESLVNPTSQVTREQLQVILLFKDVPNVNEVIPGYAEIQKATDLKLQKIETAERAEIEARQALEKETKHKERERTLEADTVDGAIETAKDNLKNQRNIGSKSGTKVALAGREEPFDCYLEIIFNNPLIKKALAANKLDGFKLSLPLNQLEALLTIQASPDLRAEAERVLSETVPLDWTGWGKTDYQKAKQEGRWNEIWQNHLDRTIYGYALGAIEYAVNSPTEKIYDQSRDLIIERGMDILLGDVSFIELEGDESINQRFGAGTNRARAVIRLANMISKIGNEGFGTPELLEHILESMVEGERPRITLIKNKLVELSSLEEGRKVEAEQVQKRLNELFESMTQKQSDAIKKIAEVENARWMFDTILYLQKNLFPADDFLEIKRVNGSYQDTNGKPHKVKTPIVTVKEKPFRELTEMRQKITQSIAKNIAPEERIKLKKQLADINVRLLIIEGLKQRCQDLRPNVYVREKGSTIYINKPSEPPTGNMALERQGRAFDNTISRISQDYIALTDESNHLKIEAEKASAQRRLEIKNRLGEITNKLDNLQVERIQLVSELKSDKAINYISGKVIKSGSEGDIKGAKEVFLNHEGYDFYVVVENK